MAGSEDVAEDAEHQTEKVRKHGCNVESKMGVCATALAGHMTETWPEAMKVQSRRIHLTNSDLGNTI
jgi:hypothetical protein